MPRPSKRPQGQKPQGSKPQSGKPQGVKPPGGKSRPSTGKPARGKPSQGRTSGDASRGTAPRKPKSKSRPPSPGAKRIARKAEGSADGLVRLQKALAAAGLGSRRACEEFITDGRVEIDGQVVSELGAKVDPDKQQIKVDGQILKVLRKVYYAVNKPEGVLCTNNDPDGRPRVLDLLPPTKQRLFTVGRLDCSSEGLILVTNDGDLAQLLAHPRYGVEKTYRVQVAGEPAREILDQLRQGVWLAEGPVKVDAVKIKSSHKQSTVLEIVLSEGKNREIRRMLARVGHKVLSLRRLTVGTVGLRDLKPGEFRMLSPSEVQELRDDARRVKRRRTTPSGPPVPGATVAGGPAVASTEPTVRSARDTALVVDDVMITGGRKPLAPSHDDDVEEVEITARAFRMRGGDSRPDYDDEDDDDSDSSSLPPHLRKPGRATEARDAEARPSEARPSDARPSTGRGQARPAGGRAAGGRAAGGRAAGGRRTGGKPQGGGRGKPQGGGAGESSGENQTSRGKRSGAKPRGAKPVGGKSVGGRSGVAKPLRAKPKPIGGKPAGGKPAGKKKSGGKPVDASARRGAGRGKPVKGKRPGGGGGGNKGPGRGKRGK